MPLDVKFKDSELFVLITTLTQEGKLTYAEMLDWDFIKLMNFYEFISDRLEEINRQVKQAEKG